MKDKIDVLVEIILWMIFAMANFHFKAWSSKYTMFLLHKHVWNRHVSSRSMWSWPCTQINKLFHILQVVLFPCQTFRDLTIAWQVLFQIPWRTLTSYGWDTDFSVRHLYSLLEQDDRLHFLLQNNSTVI